jgi:very-short-patch-repair endonuclease
VTDGLREVAARQHGVVAAWQLREGGWSADAVHHRVAGLRVLHDGVFVTGEAPASRVQRWWAATLTAPGRVLSFASAGAAWEMRPWEGGFEVVTRLGSGGPRRFGELLVCRAARIDATTLHGFAITTPARTICDLWPRLDERAQRKLLREALRLRRCTVPGVRGHLDAVSGRNRPATLARLLGRYERLQLHRCRSDAEAYALEVLDDARVTLPQVNRRIGGEEADLSWPQRRLIVEIDGDAFHTDKAEDARKTKIWRAAGWHVHRADSDTDFDTPTTFVTTTKARLAETARSPR